MPDAPEDTGTPTTAAPEVEAPATEAPESQTETPEEIDWKQRYEDLRPEADRRASLLADIEGRNGPDRQAQALKEHARIELEEEEGEEQPEEEFDFRDPTEEIDAIKAELAQRDEAAKAAQLDQLEAEYTEATIGELEESENFKLTDDEYDFVVNRGLANREQHGPEQGKPDLEGSFKALKKSIMDRNKGMVEGKEDVVMPPVGATGEPKIDLKDKDARQKLGREVYEAAERAKQT